MKRFFLSVVICLCSQALWAQAGDLLPNDDTYHLIDRLDIRSRLNESVPTFSRPLPREKVAAWLSQMNTDSSFKMGKRFNWMLNNARRLNDDAFLDSLNASDSVKRKFPLYRNRRDFFSYQTGHFSLYVNPVLYLNVGQDRFTGGLSGSQTIYRNGKGASLRGKLGKKLGFYAEFTDHQVVYPEFIRKEIAYYNGAIPSENAYKTIGTNGNGYDFLNARAYITYTPIKYLRIKLGRDRAFWGNGIQSFLLSDHATEYYLLDLHLKAGKFEYQCLFNEMTDYIPNKPDALGAYPNKYGAFHLLTFHPDKRVALTVFESTIYAPLLPSGQRGFELQYVNPLIFYRSVEQAMGSPDNTLLGFAWKANILRRFQFYGQFCLDDYNFSERKNGSGWWGNKYAFQTGIKAIDIFNIETLDAQLEFNTARPYAFAHYNVSANYTHFGQALGHPMGANFREFIFVLRYVPLPKFSTVLTLTYVQKGEDFNGGLNMGGNITRTNLTHDNGLKNPNYENYTLQGALRNDRRIHLRVGYQPFVTPLTFEMEAYYRTSQTDKSESFIDAGALLQIRYFFGGRSVRF